MRLIITAIAAAWLCCAQVPTAPVGAAGPTSWPTPATSASLLVAADHASTTLSADLNSTATSISVADSTNFVANSVVTVDYELIKICSKSTGTLTVCSGGRHWGNSPAASHTSGTVIANVISAIYPNQLRAEMIAFSTDRWGHIGSTVGVTPSAGNGISSWLFHPLTAPDLYLSADFVSPSLASSAPAQVPSASPATVTLTEALDASSLVLHVTSSALVTQYQILTVDREQMLVCSTGTGVITICSQKRGMGGTAPTTHAVGAIVKGVITKTEFVRLANEISAVQTDLFPTYGTGGTAVGLAWPNHAVTPKELLDACTTLTAACWNNFDTEWAALEASVDAGPVTHSNSVVAYPVPSGLSSSGAYTVTVSGTSVPVMTWRNKHFAWFAYSGTANVSINVTASVSSYVLSPIRNQVSSSLSGGHTITFSLTTSPKKLCLNKINGGGEPLYVIADPLETDAPASSGAGIYNVVTGYGADNTFSSNATGNINNAITAAANAGGGIVYVPSGRYKVGPVGVSGSPDIILKSNVKVYLAPGAVIEVPANSGCCFDSRYSQGVLAAMDVNNAKIYGRGVVYGHGQTQPGSFFRMLIGENAPGLTLQDVMLLESNDVTMKINGDNMTISNAKLLHDTGGSGGDGIDVELPCSNLKIINTLDLSSDDSIAISPGGNDRRTTPSTGSSNITITGNFFWQNATGHSFVVVPFRSIPGVSISNIFYDNNDTLDTDEWVALYPFGGTNIYNVTFSNSGVEHVRTKPFAIENVDCTSWGAGNCGTTNTGAIQLGFVRTVNITNVTIANIGAWDSTIAAWSSSADVEHIHFSNFWMNGSHILSAGAMNMDLINSQWIIDLTFQ